MTVQQQICGAWGFLPTQTSTSAPSFVAIDNLNSTNNLVAFAFLAPAATSLSAFRFFIGVSGVHGTGGTITCKLYGDSNGLPNIGGGALDTLTVGTLTSSAFTDCTGGTVSLTAGTKYWVVLGNSDASPTTNYITVSYATGCFPSWMSDDISTSTNGGTSWTTNHYSGGFRLSFADGTYFGTPLKSTSGTGFQSGGVYSANEIGIQFTTPANAKLNTAGASMYWQPNGAPTGNLYYKLYDSTHTLLAESYTIPNGEAKTQQVWKPRLWKPSTDSVGSNGIYTLSPSTIYTISLAETTQTDTSSNFFRPYGCDWDTDINSTPLIPWSMQLDAYNGTTWTQTAAKFFPFALSLATGNEFTSLGGGGGGTVGYAWAG